jgi:hypothetical protein
VIAIDLRLHVVLLDTARLFDRYLSIFHLSFCRIYVTVLGLWSGNFTPGLTR